jgi:hypothetical protein
MTENENVNLLVNIYRLNYFVYKFTQIKCNYEFIFYRILSTSNRSPIHLWNAKDGHLEATYRVYDQYVFSFVFIYF